MKAVQAAAFGRPNDVLSVQRIDKPKSRFPADATSKSLKSASTSIGANELLIEVFYCSLSPSDYRILLGDAPLFKKPEAFPYTPGGDVSGRIVEVGESAGERFGIGDLVVATWTENGVGGLAEFLLIDAGMACKIPQQITPLDACAMVNSSVNAMTIVKDAQLSGGERVLVLGGSGGVGSAIIKHCKRANVAFIAATSSDTQLLTALGVDRPIDYRSEDWWLVDDFQQQPFDVVFDCAIGEVALHQAMKHKVITSKSLWKAIVLTQWDIVIPGYWSMMKFSAALGWRLFKSKVMPSWPRYQVTLPSHHVHMHEFFEREAQQPLGVVIHQPLFDFTTQGVCDAFNCHIARKGHGKIVIVVKAGDEQS